MLADPNLPKGAQMEIAANMADQMRFQKMEAEKREQYTRAIETGDLRGLQREDRKAGGEGSWLRYIMFGLLGSPSAQIEKQRLMPELFAKSDYITMTDGQTQAVIMRDDNGNAIRGTTADGRALTRKELIENGKPSGEYDIVGGTFVSDTMKDSKGNPLVGSLYRNKKKPDDQFIQTSEGKKSLSGFRPQSSQGSLSDMRSRQIQQLNIDLQGKTEQEKMAIARDYNSRLVAQGFQPVQPYEMQLSAPQIGGGQPAPMAQPAPTTGPVTPGAVPPAATPQPQPQPQAQPAPVAVTRPTGTALVAAEEGAKTEARAGAEDVGKIKANIGQIRDNADYLTTKIDELINHEGFKFNVGVADVMGGIPVPFGATVAGFVPGTETSDWKARFEEIKGQQFLQGIQQLKGTGAISDREGAAAEKAISRMRTSQSEKEFREAADDFQNIIKRGVDRSMKKVGQPPIYNALPASEGKREREKAAPGSRENPIKL
jgi:hypothetical protein